VTIYTIHNSNGLLRSLFFSFKQEEKMKKLLVSLTIALAASTASAREQISIVGSSTVYPFATIVAEKFGQEHSYPTPVIESTGTGGGMKLFCKGLGVDTPDITNASRAIKKGEAELCKQNGVTFQEFVVGNDGLAFAQSLQGASMDLNIEHIAAALAHSLDGKENTLMTWDQVDAYVAEKTNTAELGLPNRPISVMIPPPTSGTRDAMGSLFMKAGWKKLGFKDKGYKKLREDGVAIEMGENDNLIVEKLTTNPDMFGIFGYSFFDTNRDKVQASRINQVELTFENIASYTYPGARPLYFYVKKEHIQVIPGLSAFIQSFISDKAMGMDGYLFAAGLVPLSASDFSEQTLRLAQVTQ
jgi:phosphate transport system substrate-binding protein